MIRHSPCEFYLKFLLVHPDKLTTSQIEETCTRQQLDFLDAGYLDQLRAKCSPPNPFYPADPLHSRSQRFVFKERIQQLFIPDEDMQITLRLLGHARGKEFVESMILAGAPLDRIAQALTAHRGFTATARAVEYYKHFFWNVDLVDSTEIRALLQLRAPEGDSIPSDQKRSASALKKAYKDDPRVIAANLPSHPIIAMMSQIRMGLMPRSMDLASVIETARNMATIRTLEATLVGGPFDSKKALEYSTVAKNMNEMLETVVKPDERLRAELSAIALKTEEGPVPYIHELSDGQHTVEVSPGIKNASSGERPDSSQDTDDRYTD